MEICATCHAPVRHVALFCMQSHACVTDREILSGRYDLKISIKRSLFFYSHQKAST